MNRTRLLPQGIRARLFLLIALVLLPLIGLLAYNYQQHYKLRRAQALQTELEVAQGLTASFTVFVVSTLRLSQSLGQTLVILPAAAGTVTDILTSTAAQYPAIRHITWVRADGVTQASSNPRNVGVDLSSHPYVQAILAGRPWVLADLAPQGITDDRATLTIATGIRDGNNDLQGLVVTSIEPLGLGELILYQARPAAGRVVVFDRQGTVVYREPEEALTWDERRRWLQSDPLLRRALETGVAQTGAVELAIPGGRWLSARIPMPEFGWVVGAGQPMEVALAPVRQQLRQDLTLAGLIGTAAFLLAWVVSRSIAGPLRNLEEDARMMGGGRLIHQDDVTAPEEIKGLRTTVEGLARSLLARAEALRMSEERLHLALDTAQMGVWELNLGDQSATRTLEHDRIFGYQTLLPAWTYDIFLDHVLAEDRPMVERKFGAAMAGDQDWHFECRIQRADGALRWIEAQGRRYPGAGKQMLRMVGLVADITERKEAEEALRRLKEELEDRVEQRTAELTAANRELEIFAYTVSHDLRAPLRHVSSFTELLEEDIGPQLDQQGQHYVRIIAEASRRMGALIDDLLMFSRLGRGTIDKVTVSLSGLVEAARAELAPETAGRNIDWRIGPLPSIQGDANLLRSVLINLLGNALKYTGGRDPACIEVGARRKESELIVFVRDNGAGFDMRYADRLFGVFQRLHPASQFEGTGIGLASVRRIIERHSGRVWAQGEVGKGATFYFALPYGAEGDGKR